MKKTYKRLAVIYFLLSIQMNILTLYNNCYVIFTTYMLDSALELHICSVSKNLSLLPSMDTEIDSRYGK